MPSLGHVVFFIASASFMAILPAVDAGTYEEPEVKDVRLDQATEPGGVSMCPAGVCPPSFQTFPGDLEQAWVGPETDDALQVNLQINGSAASGPSSTFTWTWTLHWSLDGVDGKASATMLASGALQCGGLAASCQVNVSAEPSSRILELIVPRLGLGDPKAGATLGSLWAESHGRPHAAPDTAAGASDRAPNGGVGSDYTLKGRPPAPVAMESMNSTTSPSAPSAAPEKSSPAPAAVFVLAGLGLAVVLARRRT